ncbi:hypothetical protein [Shouchella miscanthi]|uniref:Uncharacterized protein n=1 Tax=Shouchella miscanthi TaxID=2598861 RepID=A0ABU6NFA9_9BACI|nr:hypothetical protein [Shouchella miscanthi]
MKKLVISAFVLSSLLFIGIQENVHESSEDQVMQTTSGKGDVAT